MTNDAPSSDSAEPGRSAPPGDVHVGRDGYLFLSGGRHGVFRLFSGEANPTASSPSTFIQNQAARAEACAQDGRAYRMVVFPEKCVTLADRIEGQGELSSLYERHYRDGVDAASGLADRVIYPLAELAGIDAPFDRTDTHLSIAGAEAVARRLVGDLLPDQQEALAAGIADNSKEREVSGDLGSKFDPPVTELRRVLPRPASQRMASNGIRGGNDGILVLLEAPDSSTDATLLIFGDSFFRAMLPMLGLVWRRIVFCRTRFFHPEMVRAMKPDHVLGGVAERYLSRCEPDAMRPHFLAYPLILGRATDPDPDFPEMWNTFFDREALL
ncbi:hypothetical protein N9W17_04140 [Jannaschia sp.]|nr:hypothetical protein [Jannaschia sp.]